MDKLPKVIALLGPTGTGKTDIAVTLAKRYQAHIINLDSVQTYRELSIGSAKPSLETLEEVPHYLINTSSIDKPHNSFEIFNASYALIQELFPKKNIILTGGTGLYYKNLLWGMFSLQSKDLKYRQLLELQRTEELYEILSHSDPLATQIIHPHDRLRIIRALEVFHVSGKSIITLQNESLYTPPAPFLLLGISYPRAILYERINQRVEKMLESGLLEEIRSLLDQGYAQNPTLNKIIGYKELLPYFQNEASLEDCIQKIKQNTRQYAKRQLTLFRHIPHIQWFEPPEISKIIDYIEQTIKD